MWSREKEKEGQLDGMRPDGIDGRHLVTRLVTLLSIRIRLPKHSRLGDDCIPFLIMLGTRGDEDLQ